MIKTEYTTSVVQAHSQNFQVEALFDEVNKLIHLGMEVYPSTLTQLSEVIELLTKLKEKIQKIDSDSIFKQPVFEEDPDLPGNPKVYFGTIISNSHKPSDCWYKDSIGSTAFCFKRFISDSDFIWIVIESTTNLGKEILPNDFEWAD